MRNMTVTLDEEVARWVRIQAAREEKSVSRLLGEVLRQRMLEERGYEAAMKAYLSAQAKRLKRSGGYPSRDSLHERKSLR
jgi:plasmid stability protein